VQKARELRPNDPAIGDTLGWIHVKKKNYPAAIAALKQSSEAFKDSNPTVLYHLAVAYDKNGDEAAARETLKKAFATQQAFPETVQAQKLYEALGGKP
jgi:Flp pilus assembly protein TadD